jgi:hypothetical protein
MSPRTTAENTKEIEELKTKQVEQDVRNAKIDLILETLVKQQELFEKAVTQFGTTVTSMQLAITRLEDRQGVTWKVIGVVGSVIMLIAGTILGQYVHFYP